MKTTAISLGCAICLVFFLSIRETQAQRPDNAFLAVWSALEAWDVPGARARFDAIDASNRDNPRARRVEAQLFFEEGRLDEAVAVLDTLQIGGSIDPNIQLIRDTHALTRRYKTIESANFRLRFSPGKDELLVPYAIETLEGIRTALQHDLGHVPPGKIIVEIYEKAEALSKVSSLPIEAIRTTGTVAICKFNKLMITSPKALVQGYGWRDALAHEYVHLVVSQMSGNHVPIWVHEGLAKFFESRWNGVAGRALSPASAAFLFQEQKKGALIPFEKMHPSLALLPSQDEAALAYAEAFSAIEFLHGRGGNELLVRLIQAFAEGKDDQQAIHQATARPFAHFLRDWKRYLANRPAPREALSLVTERRRFADGEETSEGKGNPSKVSDDKKLRIEDFLDIQDEEARRRAHLGELLRVRGRNAAAVDEFAQAHARVGHRSPMLSSRYAQALVALGEKVQAEALLSSSLALFPGQVRANALLGDLYFANGRLESAKEAFLEVIGVNPFDPRPHAILAEIYAAQGKPALETWERETARFLKGEVSSLPELPSKVTSPARSEVQPVDETSYGVLVLESHPFGKVLVDGIPTGRSTPTKLELLPGSHLIRVVNEEREFAMEARIDLKPGEMRTLRLDTRERDTSSDGSD